MDIRRLLLRQPLDTTHNTRTLVRNTHTQTHNRAFYRRYFVMFFEWIDGNKSVSSFLSFFFFLFLVSFFPFPRHYDRPHHFLNLEEPSCLSFLENFRLLLREPRCIREWKVGIRAILTRLMASEIPGHQECTYNPSLCTPRMCTPRLCTIVEYYRGK